MNIFERIKSAIKSATPKPPPKWRLRPDSHGTYFLDKWNPDVSMYLCEKAGVTKESADKAIKNLERPTLINE